jgi:hypothetical protein
MSSLKAVWKFLVALIATVVAIICVKSRDSGVERKRLKRLEEREHKEAEDRVLAAAVRLRAARVEAEREALNEAASGSLADHINSELDGER